MGKMNEKESKARVVLDRDREKECAGSLSRMFDELMECSIEKGRCRELFFTEGKCRLCVNQTLEELRAYALDYIHPEECMGFLDLFNKDRMREVVRNSGHPQLEFRCRRQEGGYTWLRILLMPEQGSFDTVLCYVVDLGAEDRESHLLKQIVDRYVYRNCDYLICLDSSRDSYTMFRRNEGADLFPSSVSGTYSQMVNQCISRYVVLEEREQVRQEMDLDHVLEILDLEGEHVFTCGVVDQNQEYFRKRFQYVYYDRPNHILLLMRTDITKEYKEQCRQKKRLREALWHARVDSLTGLYNAQAMQKEIRRLLKAPSCPPAALLFIDLDNFKSINDTMGHRSGDMVLCRVSELFRQTLRSKDLIGRAGGDEFIAFLTGVSPEESMECARRLCHGVESMTDPQFGRLSLSCSIGGAVCPQDGRDYDTLFLKADAAVYEAKHRGRNQCMFYGPNMNHSTRYL